MKLTHLFLIAIVFTSVIFCQEEQTIEDYSKGYENITENDAEFASVQEHYFNLPKDRYWIETQQLEDIIKAKTKFNNESIKIIDATLGGNLFDFNRERIPGAIFFSHFETSEPSNPMLMMLPKEKQFREAMQKLDIKTTDTIILYDKFDNKGAVRAWYIFDVFGHKNKYVLNGSLQKWKMEKRIIDTTQSKQIIPGQNEEDYNYKFNENLVEEYHDILEFGKNYEELSDSIQLIDVRPPQSFTYGGHVPGSINMPFTDILIPEQAYTFKEIDYLKQQVEDFIKINKKVVIMCVKGIASSFLYVVLKSFGIDNISIYDGSWLEYANRQESVIAK